MARVQPDRRWFGNTRVIGQRQLEQFREAMAEKVNDPYQMLMRQSKLPMSLLEDNVKVSRHRCAMTADAVQSFPPDHCAMSMLTQEHFGLAATTHASAGDGEV
jgi:nuclear GTP-binding protein